MGDNGILEWDLPEGVLGVILEILPIKQMARCSCVAKSWRHIIQEDYFRRKVRLERAWRDSTIEPKELVHDPTCRLCAKSSAKGGDSGSFIVANIRTGGFTKHNTPPVDLCFCFISGMLLSIGGPTTIRVLETPKLNEIATFQVPFTPRFMLNVEDSVAIIGAQKFGLWKKFEWTCVAMLRTDVENCKGKIIHCVAWDKETSTLVCGLEGGGLKLWNLASLTLVQLLKMHSKAVLGVDVNKSTIVSSSKDSWVKGWRRETGAYFFGLKTSLGVNNVVVLNGERLACKASNYDVDVWDISEGHCVRRFQTDQPVAFVYLTKEKLTIVQKCYKLLEWDFASFIG